MFNWCFPYEKTYFTHPHGSHALSNYNLLNEVVEWGRECEAAGRARLAQFLANITQPSLVRCKRELSSPNLAIYFKQ